MIPSHRPSPARPISASGPDLSRADRLALSMVRRYAAGLRAEGLRPVAQAMLPPGAEEAVIAGALAFGAALDDSDGPDVHLRRGPCRKVTADEITILRLLGVSQSDDGASAETFALPLVSAERVEELLTQAGAFAAVLRRSGQRLTLTAPAPVFSIP